MSSQEQRQLRDPRFAGLAEPLDAFIALARDTGAAHLANEARRIAIARAAGNVADQRAMQQALCDRLAHHLCELQCALGRTDEAGVGVVNALSILRVIAGSAIEELAPQPDADRTWLMSERAKFLMATRVDATLAVAQRIESTQARSELWRSVETTALQVVNDLLAAFRERLQREVERRLAIHANRLLVEIEDAIGDLGQALPLETLANVPVVLHAFTGPVEAPQTSNVVASVLVRVGLTSRQRIESLARGCVLDGLERGSRQLVVRVLHDFAAARKQIEQHLCHALDGFLASAQYAVRFADEARYDGTDGVMDARSRIVSWSATLAQIRGRWQ